MGQDWRAQPLILPDTDQYYISRGITNTPFHRHQQTETLSQYSQPVIGLLSMLLRPKKAYQLVTTPGLDASLTGLEKAMSSSDANATAFCIHNVLMALWTVKWQPLTSLQRLTDPTICYMALSMLESDGSFCDPEYTSGYVGKFVYCMRLSFLVEMRRIVVRNPGMTIEESSAMLECWYTEKMESTFNSLQSLTHRASAIGMGTMSMPRLWWLDRVTYQSMLYRGTPLHLSDVRKVFTCLEDSTVALWENKVLLGLPLRVDYGDLADDLTNTSVGYSFLTDHRNKCFENTDKILVNAILKDPSLRKKFILGNNARTGSLIWNKPALRTWLFNYANFEGEQMTRMEMTGGSPGRITELACMNYRNTKTRPRRNFTAFGKHIAVLRMYHKSGALSGVDKLIPHALDAFTSDLVIQDLALARPFARFVVGLCFPDSPDIARVYRDLLFVRNGREFTTADLSASMVQFTFPIVGLEMAVNVWRHTTSAWKRKLCNSMQEIMEDAHLDTINALQAGRTRQTENRIYGISHDALAGSGEDVLPLYLDSSTDWQKQLHVVPGGLQLTYKEASGKNFKDLVKAGVIKFDSHQNQNASYDMDKIVDRIVEKLHPALESMVEVAVAKASQCQCQEILIQI
jgi:hypothetical protein